MPQGNDAEAKPFSSVFRAEAEAIGARRAALNRAETGPWPVVIETRAEKDERGRVVPIPAPGSDLVGLALSGGGVRSAAFCLGVLQGLDATVEDNKLPQVFDAIDYLSTVSGGGYIGTSLITGLMQTGGQFPFTSKLDQNETIETQHIRDYSNYLAPEGAIDWLVGLVVLIRGLLINAMIFMSVILFGAVVTVGLNPTQLTLAHSRLDFTYGRFPNGFLWTSTMIAVFLLGQVLYAIIAPRLKRHRPTLRQREAYGRLFVSFLILFAAVAFLETQAFILSVRFDLLLLDHCPTCAAGSLGKRLHLFEQQHGDLPSLWKVLVAAGTATVAFGGKIMNVAKATLGDDSWMGFLKRWASRIALYLAAMVAPLSIWATYLAFSYWGIAWKDPPGADTALQASVHIGPHAPRWLQVLAENAFWPNQYLLVYVLAFVLLFAASLCVTPNANSLHAYYRDRLSRAFLWQRNKLLAEARLRDRRPRQAFGLMRSRRNQDDVDQFKLSSLKPASDATATGENPVAFAPYLLINAAVNLEASKYLNRRGRNADSFVFSPFYAGSEATRYVATKALETLSPEANVGTAMAISGAAASANMGASTIRVLTFTLAALNVRLGFWLPNPRLIARWSGWRRRLAGIGPYFFTRETLGLLDEWSENIYLTDGGHFDNLGLYELLKRRCRIVLAVDAEADPPMNFESLVRLQRYARIDLGVRIDLPWEDLRRFSRTITVTDPHGPKDDPKVCIGPHVALGRIDYGPGKAGGPDESGVLIYIKSCISGDENDLIRDYRRRNGDFPHETTLDQFFTEEQFEVYRALGFHATKSFFSGQDRFAMRYPAPEADWAETVRSALKRLHVPAAAIDTIVQRQQDGPGR